MDYEDGVSVFLFFFFQAEDGIRDYKVTGVQTCALPISRMEYCNKNVCACYQHYLLYNYDVILFP